MKRCSCCGDALAEEAVFCIGCGFDLRTGRRVAVQKGPQPVSPRDTGLVPSVERVRWQARVTFILAGLAVFANSMCAMLIHIAFDEFPEHESIMVSLFVAVASGIIAIVLGMFLFLVGTASGTIAFCWSSLLLIREIQVRRYELLGWLIAAVVLSLPSLVFAWMVVSK